MIDQSRVARLAGDQTQLTEPYILDDDEPVRRCRFTASSAELGWVEVTMQSRLIVPNGPLEVHAPGLSELRATDNLSTHMPKRTGNSAVVSFEIDNLDVLVSHMNYTRPTGGADLPDPATATRVREDIGALARQIASTLEPRNRTEPIPRTLP